MRNCNSLYLKGWKITLDLINKLKGICYLKLNKLRKSLKNVKKRISSVKKRIIQTPIQPQHSVIPVSTVVPLLNNMVLTVSSTCNQQEKIVRKWNICRWISVLSGLAAILLMIGSIAAWCLNNPLDRCNCNIHNLFLYIMSVCRYLVLLDAGSVHTSVYTYR